MHRILPLALIFLLPAAAPQDEKTPLAFKYAKGDRENMRMDIQMAMAISLSSEAVELDQTMEGPVGLTLKLECKKPGDKEFALEVGFGDFEMEQDMDMGGQKLKMIIKGEDVRVEGEDGEAIIDTEEGINEESAADILKEFEDLKEKAEFSMTDRGLIKGLAKDAKLREFLGGMNSENLFPVVLPENPVKVGESWIYKTKLDRFGKFEIKGKSPEIPVTYKLEKIEGEGESAIAVISMKVDETLKDIKTTGELEGVAGEVTLNIQKIRSSGTGTTRFHISKGRIVESAADVRVEGEFEMEGEQLGGTMDMDLDLKMKATIKPIGTKTESTDKKKEKKDDD